MNVTYSGFLKEKSILSVTGERDRAYNGASFFLSWTIVRGRSCCWNLCIRIVLLSSKEWIGHFYKETRCQRDSTRQKSRYIMSFWVWVQQHLSRINTLAGLHACDVIDRGCDAWYSKLWLRSPKNNKAERQLQCRIRIHSCCFIIAHCAICLISVLGSKVG